MTTHRAGPFPCGAQTKPPLSCSICLLHEPVCPLLSWAEGWAGILFSLPALKGSDRPAFLSVIPFPSLTKKAFIPMSCLWILLVPARQSGAEMYLCHACAQGH